MKSMSITMIVIIWVAGIIPGYLSLRTSKLATTESWSKGDRMMGIIFSFCSWLMVITSFIVYLIYKQLEKDEPATW